MKKRFISIMIMAAIAIGTISAQDLKEVLDNFFETVGQENLLKVKSQVATGKASIPMMGIETPFKMMQKRPGKMYLEIEIQGALMKQAYDGETGWTINPMTGSADPIQASGPELRSLEETGDMDGYLWNYEEKGHDCELVGKEDLEGTEVYVVKLTKSSGDISTYYIDADNYVAIKMVNKVIVGDQEMEQESLMSNFQDIDGIIIPFTTEQKFQGQTAMIINIEKIDFNVDIDESLFKMPAKAE